MSNGLDWRWVITDLDTVTITFLDRLARSRELLYTLDAGAVSKCDFPADNPEVNILHTDGDPFVSFNNRLLYCFRREPIPASNPPAYNWVPRFAGTVMQLEDEAQSDQATTHLTAFDPWQLLMRRPLVHQVTGGYSLVNNTLPYNAPGQTPIGLQHVAINLLKHTEAFSGPARIDYGQTTSYNGTIEAIDPLYVEFTQGNSVGEAWTQLCDTGALDIVLKPIYDPVNRPGFLAELSIYKSAGSPRYKAIFAWDKPSRSLVGVNYLYDGTEMANNVLYFTSAGVKTANQLDAASIAKYGQYWLQQTVSDQASKRLVELLALAEMLLRRKGKRSLTIDVVPERGPVLFNEYFLGDTVPIYASNRLRQEITSDALDTTTFHRIYAIPVSIRDDGVETVSRLLLTSPETAL